MKKIKFGIVDNSRFGFDKEYVALDENNKLVTQQTYRTLTNVRKDVKLRGK